MATLLKVKKPRMGWQSEVGRFSRFLVVGLSGTLVDFLILSVLKYFFNWPTLPANLISYSCGIINNYLLSQYWVYPETRGRQSLVQLGQFVLISLMGLVLNNVLVLALEGPMGKVLHNPAYGYLPAKAVATGVVLIWNFFANRYWTFNKVGQGQVVVADDTPTRKAA